MYDIEAKQGIKFLRDIVLERRKKYVTIETFIVKM